MNETSSPSLPAIRERENMTEPDLAALRARLEKAQETADGWRVATLLADLEGVLSLVARLQGEREELRLALDNTSLQRLDDASPCWCPNVREYADSARVEHVPYCRAARAALGEEADG